MNAATAQATQFEGRSKSDRIDSAHNVETLVNAGMLFAQSADVVVSVSLMRKTVKSALRSDGYTGGQTAVLHLIEERSIAPIGAWINGEYADPTGATAASNLDARREASRIRARYVAAVNK